MPCFHPLTAYRTEGGEIVFRERADSRPLELPCGRCIGCRLERSRQWAVRIMHEAKGWEVNSFLTLTYSDNHLRPEGLRHRDFQLFWKRLVKATGPKRFYMAGEYGETTGRAHYHACAFGYKPADLVYHARTDSGERLYTSESLTKLWGLGHASVGEVTFESAAYVARYVMKKVTGQLAQEHYAQVDENGELTMRTPEYNCMSRRPGIGRRFVERWRTDIYPHDHVVVNGKACKPPRYYDKWLAMVDPAEWDEVKVNRELEGQGRPSEPTERLLAMEKVQQARLNQLRRKL